MLVVFSAHCLVINGEMICHYGKTCSKYYSITLQLFTILGNIYSIIMQIFRFIIICQLYYLRQVIKCQVKKDTVTPHQLRR